MSNKRISVVLPVYNEAENIRPCLERLWSALREQEHEILVCYDFDEDTTLSVIEAMENRPPTVRLVKNDLGPGVAFAMRAGIQAATGDVIVTTMADLSDPPKTIPVMAEKVRQEGADVVSGSRYMRGGSQKGGPLLKRLMSRAAGLSLRWVAGVQTCDATTNFRAYRREFLQRVPVESDQGFEMGLELTVKAHLQGFKVAEVPSSWVDRSAGQSRFRLWQWLPHYFHWYQTAMAAPTFTWVLFSIMTFSAFLSVATTPEGGPVTLVVILALGVVAFAMILVARRCRGRMSYTDALFPLAWLHPGQGQLLLSGNPLPLICATMLGCATLLLLVGRCDRRVVETRKASATRAHLSFLTALVIGALLWLSLLRFPVPRGPDLDPSWGQSLGYLYQHNFQAGVDYIFTYGPLGYFSIVDYNADLFWQRVVWELVIKLLMAVLLICRCWDSQGNFPKFLYWALLLTVLPIGSDVQYDFTILTLAVLVLNKCDRMSAGTFAIATFFFAVISMVKFTFFILTAICVPSIAAALWRKRSGQIAVGVAVLFASELLVVWSLCGQSFSNILRYFSASLQVAMGYSEAMALPSEGEFLLWATIVLGLLTASLVLVSLRKPRAMTAILINGVVAAGSFLAWKEGFVRADLGHTLEGFFVFSALAPFLLWRPPAPGRPPSMASRLLLYGCSIASLIAILRILAEVMNISPSTHIRHTMNQILNNLNTFGSLNQVKEAHDRRVEALRQEYDLPQIRSRVGQQSVDIISYEQGVILLNKLNWRPRPVFQSYIAYTPELLRANAEFFESDRAPAFVIFKRQTIDGRYPTLDDGDALRVILHEYVPVLTEKSYLLLQRNSKGESGAPQTVDTVLERRVDFGEEVDIRYLGDKPHVLSLDIRYSLAGRVRKLLYKAPLLFLEIVLNDGSTQRYRIIPGMAKSGFILTPMIRNRKEIVAWYTGANLNRVVSFRVLMDTPKHLTSFEPDIVVKLYEEQRKEPFIDDPNHSLYPMLDTPMFDTAPYDIHPESTAVTVDGGEVLLVHAPGRMRFRVSPGTYRLTGQFGLLADAYTRGETDGVVFRIKMGEEDGEEVLLFERSLKPRRVKGDRGMQSLEVEFRADTGTDLVLETDPGPAKDNHWDWSYWTKVRIERRGDK